MAGRIEKLLKFVHFQKGCQAKIEYKSKYRAGLAAERIKKESNAVLYAYECPHCTMWHLTRQEQKKSDS